MSVDDLAPCPDCGVDPGHAHQPGCDIARCMRTGRQRIQCKDCDHCATCACVPCDPDIWTGQWPGTAECVEYGWFCYWSYGRGWVRCGPQHDDARPDLNRLAVEATWNPDLKRWVAA